MQANNKNIPQVITYLNYHKFIMIIVGKWYVGFENKLLDKLYRLYSVCFELYVILITQFIFVSIIIYRTCSQERVIELVCYYIQYTNMYVSSMLCRRERMRKVYQYIFDYEKTLHQLDEVPTSIYHRYTKLNRKMLLFFVLLTNITGAIWYILVIRNTFVDKTTGLCALKKGINFQIWYPFDMYNKYYLMTVLADLLFYMSVVSIHIYNKLTPVTFILFALSQIKILQNILRNLDERVTELTSTEEADAVLLTTKNCVKKHQEIIQLVHMMDNACKEIVLIIFFSNSLELAAFLVKLLTEKNTADILRTAGILVMLVTQIFMFFWYANEIQVQSTEISDIIYNYTDWMSYDKPAKMHMLLMMTRSQKPLSFRAAAIGDMSIDTFKRIMKICYSVTAFFYTVFSQKSKM
ncbi:hypothetical protein NQ315_007818 [Exocentrus adspersus]|uniref:Odorant receptor n=1 Tax=Exocentrus adspersus TaxID=1586481 RepID=A0AAV8W8K7_9CUCU|nr:hypothetical protein NQ315_007818 [Exocentrus adspersus]